MYRARFLLQPIRASLASFKSQSSQSKLPCEIVGNYRPLKTWTSALKPKIHDSVSNFHWNSFVRNCHYHIQNFCNPGGKFVIRSIFGLSVIVGSIGIRPLIGYSTDGFEFVVNDHQLDSLNGSQYEDDRHVLLNFARKLLVPVFLFLTVLMNWGHPIIIATKVALILFTTKPSPVSVYLFVEKLRHQAMQQHPFIYKFKSYRAKKVEVEDYIFLCLARVELEDQNFTLIGILGSWWILPLSSLRETFRMLKTRALCK